MIGIIHTFATVAFKFGQTVINLVLLWLSKILVLQLYWWILALKVESYKILFFLPLVFLRLLSVKQEQQKCLFNSRWIFSSPSFLSFLNSFYYSICLTFAHFICLLSLSVPLKFIFLLRIIPFIPFCDPPGFLFILLLSFGLVPSKYTHNHLQSYNI